jgi:hypothetical protein
MPFALCAACRRHVRSSESRCPFCTAAAVTAIVAGVALSSCTPDGRNAGNVYGGPPPQPTPVMAPDAGPGGAGTDPLRGGDVYGGPPPPADAAK